MQEVTHAAAVALVFAITMGVFIGLWKLFRGLLKPKHDDQDPSKKTL